MPLTPADVKKIAHLARLNMSDEDLALYTPELAHILELVDQMNQADTSSVALTDSSSSQHLRTDDITEPNQREKFQAIAPLVENGLYLVPKVIEEF